MTVRHRVSVGATTRRTPPCGPAEASNSPMNPTAASRCSAAAGYRDVRLIAAKITDGSATGPWASSLVEPLSRKPLGGQQPELVGMYSVTPYFYSAHWLGSSTLS